MIITTARVHVPPEKQEEVIRTMRRVLEPTRVKSGCVGIQCGRDIEDDNVLILIEQWSSKAHFEQHVRSDAYKIMISVLESAYERPEIRFHEVADTSGMEIVFEMRGVEQDA